MNRVILIDYKLFNAGFFEKRNRKSVTCCDMPECKISQAFYNFQSGSG